MQSDKSGSFRWLISVFLKQQRSYEVLKKLFLVCILWLLGQASMAAIVDQHLDILLTVGFIGSSVPEPYASSLNIGDVLHGSITVQNIDDTVDGIQSVSIVDHQMTIAGVSYDRAADGISPFDDIADVQGGMVDWFQFNTGNAGSGVFPDLQYHQSGFWRLIFTGWSLSSPTNFVFEINGNYIPQVAVVPVPAAVWLFVSGLLGLLGLGRRNAAA